MDLLPRSKTVVGKLSAKDLEEQRQGQEALKLIGTMGAASAAIPFGTILPFQNYLNDASKLNIKQKEAQRMFPQADPSLFDYTRGGVLANKTMVPTIPLSQSIGSSRVFNNQINGDINTLYKSDRFYPEALITQPGEPSPELGSFQKFLQQQSNPTGDAIQAITVTPGPSPSRFSDASLKNVDELGKTLTQHQLIKNNWLADKGPGPSSEMVEKISNLRNEYVPQGGYVWGNIQKPQYDYAERIDPSTGEFKQTANPSLYISKFDASPSKQADYLYTGDVENDPRVVLNQFQKEGKTTGPSWGIRSESSRAGRADADVNFRRDLIESRGELTTGDLQALLKQKGLPFDYQSNTLTNSSSNILRNNLKRLALEEGITPYQAIEKYARVVPGVGDPVTPSTEAVTSMASKFPAEGPAISPFGSFAKKVDLRQVGILPPSDKASYKAFNIDEVDKLMKYTYPRYNAMNTQALDTYTSPVNPLDPFGETEEGLSELIISRDRLRPQAANKLLNRTVDKLIKQAEPIKGLGLGGFAAGGIATAMDPAVIDALSEGNYMQAGTTALLNTSAGAITGGGIGKGLQALQAAGYGRPAAVIGEALPIAGGILAGIGAIETGKALNRAYRARTGTDWTTRNQTQQPTILQSSVTPSIQPRMGTAILGGKPVQVPYGSVAGSKTVGRPWWDKLGSKAEAFANLLNSGSILGR
jgi:hypothetical protein